MDIYDYRATKERKYARMICDERRNAKSEKISVRTEVGYIDGYLYRPQKSVNKNLPVVFNLHGGGFVLGYCEQDGKYCQMIADEAQCAVINIDYCLAPEHKFPLPVLTTYEFIKEVLVNYESYGIDKDKAVILGSSAGGTLAASLCLLAREKNDFTFLSQILNYPIVDLTNKRYQEDPTCSRTKDYINWYLENESDGKSILASPLLADLTNLPRTLMIVAELDPFMEDDIKYADKLSSSSVETECIIFKNRQHGFTHDIFENEYNKNDSDKAWREIIRFLIEIFG